MPDGLDGHEEAVRTQVYEEERRWQLRQRRRRLLDAELILQLSLKRLETLRDDLIADGLDEAAADITRALLATEDAWGEVCSRRSNLEVGKPEDLHRPPLADAPRVVPPRLVPLDGHTSRDES